MSNISELEAEALNNRTTQLNYYALAALSLYSYHYIITFSQETRVIWGRRLTGVSLLLILNRYLPFAALTLQLLTGSPILALNQYSSCLQQMVLYEVVQGTASIVIAILPALRVYAIWGQSWKCLVSVAILGLVNVVVGVITHYPSTVYSLSPLVYGCWSSPPPFVAPVFSQLAVGSFSTIIARDALVLILTWIRTYEIKKLAANAEIKTRLSTLLSRDGTVYFSFILVFNVLDLVTYSDGHLPSIIGIGIQSIEVIMQPMLLSHLMFDLREAYPADSSAGGASLGSHHASTIRFTANIVGNIGAPLAGEWFEDADDDEEPPLPVVCGDPFAFGLIKEAAETTNKVSQDAAAVSVYPEPDFQPTADEIATVEV